MGSWIPIPRQDRSAGLPTRIPDLAVVAPALLPVVGWVKFHVDRNFAEALDLFCSSDHLRHTQTTTRLRIVFATSRGRFDEALEWIESALLIDPYASWLYRLHAWTLHLAGERTKSIERVEHAMKTFPEDIGTHAFASMILAFNDHLEPAVSLAQDLVRRAPYFDVANAVHAYALACAGRHDEAREILERLQWLSRERFVLRSFSAAGFAAIGDKARSNHGIEGSRRLTLSLVLPDARRSATAISARGPGI